MITGRKGSAGFYEDVPIDDRYKIAGGGGGTEEGLDAIQALLLDVLEHYGEHVKNFEHYRTVIRSEERRFDSDLDRVMMVLSAEISGRGGNGPAYREEVQRELDEAVEDLQTLNEGIILAAQRYRERDIFGSEEIMVSVNCFLNMWRDSLFQTLRKME